MKRVLVGGCAALLLAACSEDPSVYVGGPAGAPDRVQLSSGDVVLTAGESARIGAAILDALGNVTADAPTFSACSGAPVSVTTATPDGMFSGAADVVASSTAIGEGCVNVAGGGLSDTVHVTVVPAGVRIVGDPFVGYDSQDPAANVFQFAPESFGAAGDPLSGSVPFEWTSSNEALFTVDRFSGEVITRGLGVATLRLVAPGGADHSRSLTIGAPTFNGTASAASAGQGDIVVITRTGGPVLDGNTTASFAFGATRAFLDGPTTADEMQVAVPATGVPAGRGDIVLRNVGPDELDRRVVFQATSAGTGHRHSPASNACATAPDYDANVSPGGWVYFSFTGGTAGYGGPDPDIWFSVTNSGGSPRPVTVRLEWLTNTGSTTTIADADLFVYAGCGTPSLAASQDFNPPEPPVEEVTGATVVIPAGGSMQIRAVVFDAQGAAFSNARISVVDQ